MTTYHYISESVPKFRIGGVYRDGRGLACLVKSANCKTMRVTEWVGDGWAVGDCRHDLADGKFSVYADENSHYHLIPGELVQRDGQWVPLEQTASLTFPGGGCVQLAGEKVIGRVYAQTEGEVTHAVGTILNSPMKRRDNQPPAPLPHFGQHTAYDTFGPDFIVTKGAEPTAPLYDSPTTDSAYPAIAGLLRG